MYQQVIDEISKKGIAVELIKKENVCSLRLFHDDDSFPDPITADTFEQCLKAVVTEDPTLISGELYLSFMSDVKEGKIEDIQDFTIDSPYLAGFRRDINRSLLSAMAAVDNQDTATVTAKIVLDKPTDAYGFSDNAKLFESVKYQVGVSVKRDVIRDSGTVKTFVAKPDNQGHILLIDPDRQLTFDDVNDSDNPDLPYDSSEDFPESDFFGLELTDIDEEPEEPHTDMTE